MIGKIFSRDKLAYKYFIKSVNEFYPKEIFINKLKKCGFKNCKHETLTFGLTSIYTAIKNKIHYIYKKINNYEKKTYYLFNFSTLFISLSFFHIFEKDDDNESSCKSAEHLGFTICSI